MTVASSQANNGGIRGKVRTFLNPPEKHTNLAVLENNFENLQESSKRKSVLNTLKKLDNNPRAIKNLLLNQGQEHDRAFDLLADMIRSDDTEVASSALKVFTQYLNLSTTRQALVGAEIDPAKPKTKSEKAFDEVLKFINLDSQDTDALKQSAVSIANSTGYLYQADGDDSTGTSWKRGQLQAQGKAGRDSRVFGFFETMKNTESGRLLHELLTDNSANLQELHQQIASDHTRGVVTGISDQVMESLVEQKNSNTVIANPFRLWGNKSFNGEVTADPTNKDEVEFLEGFKKGPDFKFSIDQLDKSLLKTENKKGKREELILDFMVAFELLSLRKAALMEAGKSGGILTTRASNKIQKQQEEMLEALQAHASRDPETAEAIETLFKQNGAAIFMHHMKGSIATTEKAVSALVAKEVKELIKDYGPASVRLDNGSSVTDSMQDLNTLKNENQEKIEAQTKALAANALAATGQAELLDQDAISNFERLVGLSFSTDITDETKATQDDQRRWSEIKEENDSIGTKHSYFGVTTAFKELMISMKTSSDPSIIYVRDNFERIYGMKPKAMLDKIKEREIIKKEGGGPDSFIFTDLKKFTAELSKVAKEARKSQAANPKQFEFSHAVTRPKFISGLNNIVIGRSTLKEERFISEIINADTKAHQEIGFEGQAGHLERLLLPNDIGDIDEDKEVDSSLQKAERMLGIMELERRILADTKKTDTEKENAINYIHRELLGDTNFSVANLATYKSNLDSALGTSDRDYKSVIKGSPYSEPMAELLKLRYKQDDLSVSHGKLSEQVLKFTRKENQLLVEGFDGAVPKGLFFENPEATMEIMTELRSAVQAAREAGNMEEEQAAIENMMNKLEAIGYPIDTMIIDDSLNGNSWKDEFLFSDPLFYSPGSNSSDIMKIFIEIWNSIIGKLKTGKED